MYAKKALALVAATVLAEQAMAHNIHHRHMHQHLQDRAIKDRAVMMETDVVVVTDYVTVYVTDGEQPSSTQFLAAARPSRSEGYAALSVSTSSSTSTTSTTSTTTTSSTPTPPAPVIETPPPAPTTLVTLSKPVETPAPQPAATTQAVPANVNAQQNNAPSPPAATAAVAPLSSNTGKKGFAYNNAQFVDTFFTGGNSCKGCAWAYNWDSSDYNNLRDGVEFVPMLWAPIPDHTNNWVSNVNAMIAKGSKNILGTNEPDNSGQANMSPAAAAQGHVQWMNQFAGKVRIGSPAITNSGAAGQGLDWLQQFVNECNAAGCVYDFCVTHWYADVNSAQSLFDHLAGVNQICGGKPVWLTEFAPFGSDDQIADFLKTNLPKLEALPYLERFSYFMANTGSLLSSVNSLSSYGQVYANA